MCYTDFDEEESWEEEFDESGCDYGVCEFCEDPQTKELGLCTTECAAYLAAVAADTNKKTEKQLG